ncbi:MAG: cobalamin B12-binding domain-containing protein, partial [Desulfohalobiaceae bacterium]
MKVLLINANRFKQPWPVIPFGLLWVASVLENQGHQVQVLDLCFSKNCKRDIQAALRKYNPALVGVSIRNIDNSAGYNTLFLLEQTSKDVIEPLKWLYTGPIVLGGPAVGINGAEILEYMDLEFAIRGDGEQAMIELASRLEQNQDPRGLSGLVIREQGRIIQDSEPNRVGDLNQLPTPNPARYIELAPYRRFNSPLQIQTKRGCA